MKILRFASGASILFFCVCAWFANDVYAAPKKNQKVQPVSMVDVLTTNTYAPASRDKIPCAKDKVIGKWSWETCEKEGSREDFPSPDRKWSDKAKIEALIAKMPQILNGDPKKTKAVPAAEDFPGVPEGECQVISRTVEIDPAIGGWHSLGLYAPPGQKITVSAVGKCKWPFNVRIGSQTDSLSWDHLEKNHEGKLQRPPQLTVNKRVNAGTKSVEIANPFGGLIYIDVSPIQHGKDAKVHKFEISGGIASPLYIMGPKDEKTGVEIAVTTSEDWQKQLQDCKAPWGEIATPRLIFTLPNKYLQMMKLPRRVCKQLQNGMAMCDWLIGWDLHPDQVNTPMRFVLDIQISVGWGHSGYPAMGYMAWGNCIQDGSLVRQGSWGLFHEIGHNHQWAPFRFDGCTEVTVNLFSLIAQTQGIGVPYEKAWDGGDVTAKKMRKPLKEFIASGKTFDQEEDCGLKLYFFTELMRSLGYDSFRQVALRHHKENPFNNNTTNQERWDFFFTTLCEVTNKNLTPYFELWKIDLSDKAKKQAKKIKGEPWLPCPNYPEKMPSYKAEREAIEKRNKAVEEKIAAKRKKEADEKAAAEKKERQRKLLESI